MRQTRIARPSAQRTTGRDDLDLQPDLRTPSGRPLPF